MNYEELARDEACGYLGREITDAEWREAYPEAKRKLDRIIERYGDEDGERRKPYYLGKLVQEHIFQQALSRYTIAMSELIQQERGKNYETAAAHA